MGLIRDGVIKTRKDHRCHGCGEVILKGAEVYSQTTTYDGRISTLYMCEKCENHCESRNCNECMIYEEAGPGYIKECRLTD